MEVPIAEAWRGVNRLAGASDEMGELGKGLIQTLRKIETAIVEGGLGTGEDLMKALMVPVMKVDCVDNVRKVSQSEAAEFFSHLKGQVDELAIKKMQEDGFKIPVKFRELSLPNAKNLMEGRSLESIGDLYGTLTDLQEVMRKMEWGSPTLKMWTNLALEVTGFGGNMLSKLDLLNADAPFSSLDALNSYVFTPTDVPTMGPGVGPLSAVRVANRSFAGAPSFGGYSYTEIAASSYDVD